jgi:Fe-S-cluster-containing hydrogenase component 2
MANVSTVVGLLERLNSSDLAVHQQRCVAVRDCNATCRRCAEACTSGCISCHDNDLVVEPEKCIGCGTCATACPTAALEALHPTDDDLLASCLSAAQATGGWVVVACDKIRQAAAGLLDANKVVGTVCLGRVEESLIVSLAAAGVRHVRLVRGDCDACECSAGLGMVELVSETVEQLLQAWNRPLDMKITAKFPPCVRKGKDEGYDPDRRRFFLSAKDEAKNVAAMSADYAVKDALGIEEVPEPRYVHVMEDGTLPHFIPDRRRRLLGGLAKLGRPQDVMVETRLWGHVVIDADACNSCRMCATFCPTGALKKFDDDDGTIGIEHESSACVKCRCCADICPTGALTLSEEVFAVDLADRAYERIEMAPPKVQPNSTHQTRDKMRDLIGLKYISDF